MPALQTFAAFPQTSYDTPDALSATPLHTEIAALLIHAGADPKARTCPAQSLSMERPLRVMRTSDLYCSMRAPKHRRRSNTPSAPLAEAVLNADSPMVRMLADVMPTLTRERPQAALPLHNAALIQGYADMASILIDPRVEINTREAESGARPLYRATSMGREEVVAMLLAFGTDPISQ